MFRYPLRSFLGLDSEAPLKLGQVALHSLFRPGQVWTHESVLAWRSGLHDRILILTPVFRQSLFPLLELKLKPPVVPMRLLVLLGRLTRLFLSLLVASKSWLLLPDLLFLLWKVNL